MRKRGCRWAVSRCALSCYPAPSHSPPPPTQPPLCPARTAPEMLEFLGLAPGSDQCLGFFVAGVADAERAACYKGARAPLDSCVEWRT